MKTYYVVHKGLKPGIYSTWNECKKQVDKFEGAIFKKFTNAEEAGNFLVNGFGKDKKPRIVTRRENDDKKNDNKILEQLDDNCPKIFVYTDGSCIKQKNKISVAGYGIYMPHKNIRVSKPLLNQKITNNRAEMTAIIEVFKYLDIEELQKKICILTDSQYSMYIFNGTGERYEKNGYKNDGKDVPNIDLIKKILELKRSYDVILLKVRAHTNKDDIHSKNNEIADKLATTGALSTITQKHNNSDFKNLMINIDDESDDCESDIEDKPFKHIFFKNKIEEIIDSDKSVDEETFIENNNNIETDMNTVINTEMNTEMNTVMNTVMNTEMNTVMNTEMNTVMNNSFSVSSPLCSDKLTVDSSLSPKKNNKLFFKKNELKNIQVNQLFEFDEMENSESLDTILKTSNKGKPMKNTKLSNWFVKKT